MPEAEKSHAENVKLERKHSKFSDERHTTLTYVHHSPEAPMLFIRSLSTVLMFLATATVADNGIYRVGYTGKSLRMIENCQVESGGLRIQFNFPLDAASATDADSYVAQQYPVQRSANRFIGPFITSLSRLHRIDRSRMQDTCPAMNAGFCSVTC